MPAITTLLAAASLLCLTPVGGEEFKKALDDYMAKRTELFKSGAAKAEDHNKLVSELFSKIDIPSLEADDIAALSSYGLMTAPERVAPALDRLKKLHASSEADGALALALSSYLARTQNQEADRQAFALKFTEHVKVRDVMRGPRAQFGVTALLALPKSEENSKKVMSLTSDMSEWSPEAALGGSTIILLFDKHAKNPEEREAARVRLVDFMRKSAEFKEKEGKDPGSVDFLKRQIATLDGLAARGMLLNHAAPELKVTWYSNPKLKSLADLKGKVVVLDFWATWCGPCVGSFPNVKELQAHYKGYDVAIVGVTSIQGNIIGLGDQDVIDCEGDPAKEQKLMADYMKFKDITWDVIFTEQDVFNPDFGVRGIPHVAIIDPSGKVRYNGLHPADKLEEKTKKIDAILKEFNLKTPSK